MAKRKSSTRRVPKMQPAVTDLLFTADTSTSGDTRKYIDTARELSKINRRLYQQGRMYAYQGLTFIWRADSASAVASIEVTVKAAGNTWITHNAFVKGKALWDQMQELVLEDNPSIAGKWHDFKIDLDTNQQLSKTLEVTDGSGVPIVGGEWFKSRYVLPQHEVNPATGLPLPAEEFIGCLLGNDSVTKKSLTKAYQDSRATVQPLDPNIPPGMSTSFFNLLTDSGSQEPELADTIQEENDAPPYATDDYVGGDANGSNPLTVAYGAVFAAEVDGRIGGFIAPCGLLQIDIKAYDANGTLIPPALIGEDKTVPDIDILLHVAPGMYKGVAAIPMGQ